MMPACGPDTMIRSTSTGTGTGKGTGTDTCASTSAGPALEGHDNSLGKYANRTQRKLPRSLGRGIPGAIPVPSRCPLPSAAHLSSPPCLGCCVVYRVHAVIGGDLCVCGLGPCVCNLFISCSHESLCTSVDAYVYACTLCGRQRRRLHFLARHTPSREAIRRLKVVLATADP